MIRALTGAVAVFLAACPVLAASWIKDAQNGCATSNPFPSPNESIRWFGNCKDGKLDGRGTLTWLRDGAETERNEGTFKDGELDGFVVTRSSEGYVVYGQYKQGIRHGQFMTVRNNGDHVRATYVNGNLVLQAKLTPQEIVEWNRSGGPQLIAKAPPPSETVAAAPADEEGPITGRTAVASPSRMLPRKPKEAESAGVAKPISGAAPPPVKPSGNFTFGTQVAEAIAPLGAAAALPAAAPAVVASAPALPAVPALPAAQAVAPPPVVAPPPPAAAAPRYELGTQVAQAVSQPTSLSATAPSLPPLPLPAVPQVAAPTAPPPTPVAAMAAPAAPTMTAAQVAALPVAGPAGGAPAPAARPALPPGPVGIAPQTAPPMPVAPIAGGRRPPWMSAGAADPMPLSYSPTPGATPPALPTAGLAGAAAPLAGAPSAYAPQPYVPQPFPPQPYAQAPAAGPAAVDLSPTAASRQYIATREAALQIAETQPMQALLSYRAMQSGAPYPPPVAAAQGPAPGAQQSAGLPTAPVQPAGSAETLFNQGYRMEMSGRLREAEQTYEQIILNYSATQTAMLANDRLNNIRRNTRETGVKVAERDSRVVAINEPRVLPRHSQTQPAASTGDTGAGDVRGGIVPNLTGLAVCSQSGLYESNSRWCGQVLADDGVRLSVEVKDIVLPGFGSIGIGSSKCTGGQTLNWFSKGSVVRVPRSCMELKG